MIARENGVMAGGEVVREAFCFDDDDVDVQIHVVDGDEFVSGQTLATISGSIRRVLGAERVALNFVQRMIGVATVTRTFVDAVSHTKACIVDTRKTTPGLRAFEKYSVHCGGGTNHRFSLSDAVLVKDNHLAHLVRGGLDTVAVLRRLRDIVPFTTHIEVEVDNPEQIDALLASGVVDSILIDNFTIADTVWAVERIDGRALVNASGGVSTPEHALAVAECGVDLISVGALTHSAPAVDIGLDLEVVNRKL